MYVSAIYALLLWGLTTLISLAIDHTGPSLLSSVLASLLTGFSFGIIKYLDYHLISSRPDGFPKNLAEYALNNDALEALIRWHRRFLSLKAQLITSAVIGVLGLTSTVYIVRTMSLHLKFGSYLLVFCCGFAIGHGAYCTVMIPTLTRVLSKHRMKLFWVSPADTVWINDASMFFTKLTIADSLIFAFCISGLYLLKPWHAPGTTWLALAWLLIGIICLSYVFLFPHYYLNKSIKREKKSQLQDIQKKILSYETPVRELSASHYKELMGHINVYKDLAAARESAIDLQNSSRVLTSFSVLILTYLVPFLLRAVGIKPR
jgi:hypothetical protein